MATTARPTSRPAPAPTFGRTRPTLVFIMIVAFIALQHWWVLTHEQISTKLFLFLFTFAGWCAGGIVYPPAFYALTKWGTNLPKSMKVLGGICAAAGFALGFYLLLTMYERKF